jgi:hypothetical protein
MPSAVLAIVPDDDGDDGDGDGDGDGDDFVPFNSISKVLKCYEASGYARIMHNTHT